MQAVQLGEQAFFVGQEVIAVVDVRIPSEPKVVSTMPLQACEPRILALPDLGLIAHVEIDDLSVYALTLIDVRPKKPARKARLFKQHEGVAWHRDGDRLWMVVRDDSDALFVTWVNLAGSDATAGPLMPVDHDDRRIVFMTVRDGLVAWLTDEGHWRRFRLVAASA